MLDIFFSNKIPSTVDGWTDELIRVASIHNQFDGLRYDGEEITNSFATISNRVPGVRDSSDYRDEYGAYVTYLGLMFYEKMADHWICRMNPLAQELLCGELPDPQAFMRLQMALLQYPNPIGSKIYEKGTLGIVPNALDKRFEQIQSGVKSVPFRLILGVLLNLNSEYGFKDAYLTRAELWFCLFTNPDAICTLSPDYAGIAKEVFDYRASKVSAPLPLQASDALRNLHILNHTGLVSRPPRSNKLMLVSEASDPQSVLGRAARVIAEMTAIFEIPPATLTKSQVKQWTEERLNNGEWEQYYCGKNLSLEILQTILTNSTTIETDLLTDVDFGPGAPLLDFESERRIRAKRLNARPANPDETNALREKANLQHRSLVSLLADRLRAQNRKPESNIFVDLCCTSPKKMLFEIKSCRPENLLQQVRKGISQLYEYRYRHQELKDAKLVLALESRPEGSLEWLLDYLIADLSIAVCWLEGEDNLACPIYCQDCLGVLVNRIE